MSINWGIIGCGDVVRKRVAQAIQSDRNSNLVAVCRRNEEALLAFQQQTGAAAAYTNSHDLIGNPDIDAVYIATPVNCHLPQTIAAAEAGKHVLVEKPMAMTTSECDQMIAACRDHDVKLGVAYYRRFYPVVDRMKDLIAEGAIGEVMSVNVVTGNSFAVEPDEEGYWRVIPSAGGGGALMDIGSHRINLMLDMFGPAADVRGFCDTIAASYPVDDCATLIFRFKSGPHGILQCLFGIPDDPDQFTVVGTKGSLSARPLNSGKLIVDTNGNRREEHHPPSANFNSPQIADFTAAIIENRPPRVSGEEGRETNAIIETAYSSV